MQTEKARDGRPVRLTPSLLSRIEAMRLHRGAETGRIPSRDSIAREVMEAGFQAKEAAGVQHGNR